MKIMNRVRCQRKKEKESKKEVYESRKKNKKK